MIPAALKLVPWKPILQVLAIAAVVWLLYLTVQRAWWALPEAREALKTVKAELAAERSCEVGSACAERIATAAREAEERAAQAASDALEAASAREEQAQRDAAAWRAKYRQAVQDDPGCREWSEQPVRCPL